MLGQAPFSAFLNQLLPTALAVQCLETTVESRLTHFNPHTIQAATVLSKQDSHAILSLSFYTSRHHKKYLSY